MKLTLKELLKSEYKVIVDYILKDKWEQKDDSFYLDEDNYMK